MKYRLKRKKPVRVEWRTPRVHAQTEEEEEKEEAIVEEDEKDNKTRRVELPAAVVLPFNRLESRDHSHVKVEYSNALVLQIRSPRESNPGLWSDTIRVALKMSQEQEGHL